MRASAVSILVLSALALLPAAGQAAPRTVATCDGARLDKAAGVARSLSDCGSADMRRGAEGAARQAVGRLSGALGVRRDTRDLRLLRVSPTSAGPRVRFQQFVRGVPVRNGQVAVALGENGAVTHVGNGAVASSRLDTKAAVGRAAALLTARRRVPSGFDLVAAPAARLVAEPTARGGLELAWLVVLPARAPRADWNVVVSARSGDVLKAFDSIKRVNGSALTYAPNPVQQTGDTSLLDMNDSDQDALRDARVPVTLTDLNAGTNQLRGTYVDTASPAVDDCTLPYTPGQASSPTRTYNFTRSQDAFEETVAYAAVTRVQRSYVEFGFPGIFDAPVPVDVHCTPADNSFFSTGDNALHMGDGGVDDGEDADVVVHELGHATQHAQVPGFGEGAEQGAMGEGFGDFLATYIYLQDGNAAYQATHRFCAMEWDVAGQPGTGCLRWVNGTDEGDGSDIGTYSGTPVQVHSDGRYWSAMLTCVFDGIEPSLGTAQARSRMLTLVLAHHFDLVPVAEDTGAFEDSLEALRAEDAARFNGDEISLIRQCGEDRLGITLPDDSTPPVVDGTFNPPAPDGGNGWYRTAPTFSWTVSDRQSPVQRTGCEGGVTDPADTPGRTITCTATSEGGVTAKSLTYKKDSTPPTLAPTLTPAVPRAGQAAIAAPNATDASSGVGAQSCATPDTSSAGTRTVACAATDGAGNQATHTLTYTVNPRPIVRNPTFKASRARVSSRGTLSFRLRASATGRVRIAARSGKVRFRSKSVRLTRGKTRTITLKLSRTSRRAFLRKLRGGRRVAVKVTVTPARGKKRTLTLRVRRLR